MINIKLFRNKHHEIMGFSFLGHSGYDELGKDIVCSALSSAAQLTIAGLLEVAKINVAYTLADGHIICSIPKDLPEISRQQADTLLLSLEVYLNEFIKAHDMYVSIIELEV